MNNTNIMTSLDDAKELRKLILENTDLPIVIFAGEESYTGEYAYNLAEVTDVKVKEITFDGELYIDKSDYRDKLYKEYQGGFTISGLVMQKELNECIDNIVGRTEFVKAIVVYVG